MRILLYGWGSAREHATFCKLNRENRNGDIVFARTGPNALLAKEDRVFRVASPYEAIAIARDRNIDLLLLLGTGEILNGDSQIFERAGCPVFSISPSILQLEASKRFSKKMMRKWNIPTPSQHEFSEALLAKRYLQQNWDRFEGKLVIKADSMLNPSHRAFMPDSLPLAIEAIEVLEQNQQKYFLVEERVFGPELSLHLLYDGKNYVILPPVQDYKRLLVNDVGPNTAGMGAVASTFQCDLKMHSEIEEKIVVPTISGIQSIDNQSQFILYIGIILTQDGPQALEYNVRSGSPEWLTLLPLFETSITETFTHLSERTLSTRNIRFKQDMCSMASFLVTEGYPNLLESAAGPITGLAVASGEAEIFGEDIRMINNQCYAGSGRTVAVVNSGRTWSEVRKASGVAISKINYPGMYFRDDIGASGLNLSPPIGLGEGIALNSTFNGDKITYPVPSPQEKGTAK